MYAYIAGIVAVLMGAALVFFRFLKLADERRLLEECHADEMAVAFEGAAASGTQRAGTPG